MWNNVNLEELSHYMGLKNPEVANFAMVKAIEYETLEKNIFPVVTNVSDLCVFKAVSPERHYNFAKLWYSLTFLNVFSNVFLWLYL